MVEAGRTGLRLTVGKGAFFIGRSLQVIGLIAMPGALWASAIRHSEKESIFIFLGSAAIFYLGYLLTQLSAKI